ncbi:MAG TPA: NTP transferase domain-containing protein [Thermoanaerobaculia bacterium]|nr:NTP transferase domain-containing protein [Thermoanaerobaculia bacterium]
MIAAIILAAGQATRFGRCKQLMPLGERTLLEHVLDNVNRSDVDDVVVVLGAHADEITNRTQFRKERVVINEQYAQGLSSSLQAGLRALPQEATATLIVLADQPFVTSQTLNILIDSYNGDHPEVVIPTYNGFRGNPVLVDRSLFEEMLSIRGDVGCRAIFGEHAQSILKVAVDDPGIVQDIDTVEDLARAQAAATPAAQATQETTPNMNDDDVPQLIVELRRRKQPFAVATVVRVERPTSSKPGDKAVIQLDRSLTGWIGGSCAHDLVIENSLQALVEGRARLLTLSNAEVQERKREGVVREGVVDVPMRCYSGGVLDIFIEPNLPSPELVVLGYEPVARALARIGRTMHFHVTIVDPLATPESVPEANAIVNELNLPALPLSEESFIVIATHGRFDEDAIEQALKTTASYIALVASPRRAGVVFEQMRARGISEDDLRRIKSPAGLDIGAVAPEEIALSVLAEIVRERRAGRLKRVPVAHAAAEIATEAIDPICKMSVTIAGARYSSEHDGRRYYFCCALCQRTFENDPTPYIDTRTDHVA